MRFEDVVGVAGDGSLGVHGKAAGKRFSGAAVMVYDDQVELAVVLPFGREGHGSSLAEAAHRQHRPLVTS
jgi:hypothetical protein